MIGPKKAALRTKYSDETHFCFGVALFRSEGTRLELLEHTRKKEVLCSHCERLVKEEMRRAKALSGNYTPYAISQRPEGAVRLDNSTLKVASTSSKKKYPIAQIDTLDTSDLIAATNPPQGIVAKSFSGAKFKIPFFLPPTSHPSINHF